MHAVALRLVGGHDEDGPVSRSAGRMVSQRDSPVGRTVSQRHSLVGRTLSQRDGLVGRTLSQRDGPTAARAATD